jgi:hypothetical protein
MSKIHKWQGDKRLQTQVLEIAENTVAIRSLDWDRDRFDIEFACVCCANHFVCIFSFFFLVFDPLPILLASKAWCLDGQSSEVVESSSAIFCRRNA